jgi:regulatory protein
MTFSRRKEPYTVAELYDYAVGALARRARSVAELKRLLRPRVAGQEAAETMVQVVIDKLKEQHYLNDTEFATAYSGFRRDDKFGRRRVITDLKNKGVHGDVIEKSVGEAYEGVDEEKLAREYLQRKRLKKPEDQKQAAKVFRALVRAGFTTRTIFAILKKWDVDDEVITALEGEVEE